MDALNNNNLCYFPKELHKEIHNKLETCPLVKCREVCQLWKALVEGNAQYDLALTEHKFILAGLKTIPQEILEVFGCYKKMLDLPILSTGNREADYLDFFEPEEMIYPVMRGKDNAQRAFIAFKLSVNEKPFIITLFQRCTNHNMWLTCPSHSNSRGLGKNISLLNISLLGFRGGIMHKNFIHTLKQLLNGDTVKISSELHITLAKRLTLENDVDLH